MNRGTGWSRSICHAASRSTVHRDGYQQTFAKKDAMYARFFKMYFKTQSNYDLPIFICHFECSRNFFTYNQWLCKICHIDKANRNNPFDNLNTENKYDPFNIEDIDDIKTVSKILNASKSYNHNSLKNYNNP